MRIFKSILITVFLMSLFCKYGNYDKVYSENLSPYETVFAEGVPQSQSKPIEQMWWQDDALQEALKNFREHMGHGTSFPGSMWIKEIGAAKSFDDTLDDVSTPIVQESEQKFNTSLPSENDALDDKKAWIMARIQEGLLICSDSLVLSMQSATGEIKTMAGTQWEDLVAGQQMPEQIDIPILLYHHLADEATNSMTVTGDTFQAHMTFLKSEGYNTISFDELIAYVESGAYLPKNPVIITFDDGYLSNYEIAYPILKEHNMKATIFPIGVTFGKDLYKDFGKPITPHFGTEEAQEMYESGLISLYSHSYDMHQVDGLDDSETIRRSILRRPEEYYWEYEEAFRTDTWRSVRLLESTVDHEVNVFAYPYGENNEDTEKWLGEIGFKVTLLMGNFTSTVEQGNMDSLRLLGRYTVTNDTSKLALLEFLRR